MERCLYVEDKKGGSTCDLAAEKKTLNVRNNDCCRCPNPGAEGRSSASYLKYI